MIIYDKSFWGFGVLVRMYGSAFPRALPFSLLSCIIAGVLSYFYATELDEEFVHPYPFQTFAFIAGFMVVFRSNLSYGRYWEGRSQLQQMTSKLTDCVVMALKFDRETISKENPTQQQIEDHRWFRDTMIHLVSLMHAVALGTLRTDFNMENIVAHDSLASAPHSNIQNARKSMVIEEEHETRAGDASHTSRKGNAIPKDNSLVAKEPPPNGGVVNPDLRPQRSLKAPSADMHAQVLPKPSPSSGAYNSYGTDIKYARQIYKIMKLPVVGGLTQAEGVALGAFVSCDDSVRAIPDTNLGIHGVLLEDGTYAPAPTERVHTVLAWIQETLIERIHAGGVKAAPPIQSRLHQVLSDSMLGYEHCKKLMDTPFPFPWAQAVNFVLIVFCLTVPFVIVAHTTTVYMAVAITFIAVHTHVMLNEVARDIEDPYHYDPNELPLPQLQYRLNERLLSVCLSKRPVAFTDVGQLTGPGNTIAFNAPPRPPELSPHQSTMQQSSPPLPGHPSAYSNPPSLDGRASSAAGAPVDILQSPQRASVDSTSPAPAPGPILRPPSAGGSEYAMPPQTSLGPSDTGLPNQPSQHPDDPSSPAVSSVLADASSAHADANMGPMQGTHGALPRPQYSSNLSVATSGAGPMLSQAMMSEDMQNVPEYSSAGSRRPVASDASALLEFSSKNDLSSFAATAHALRWRNKSKNSKSAREKEKEMEQQNASGVVDRDKYRDKEDSRAYTEGSPEKRGLSSALGRAFSMVKRKEQDLGGADYWGSMMSTGQEPSLMTDVAVDQVAHNEAAMAGVAAPPLQAAAAAALCRVGGGAAQRGAVAPPPPPSTAVAAAAVAAAGGSATATAVAATYAAAQSAASQKPGFDPPIQQSTPFADPALRPTTGGSNDREREGGEALGECVQPVSSQIGVSFSQVSAVARDRWRSGQETPTASDYSGKTALSIESPSMGAYSAGPSGAAGTAPASSIDSGIAKVLSTLSPTTTVVSAVSVSGIPRSASNHSIAGNNTPVAPLSAVTPMDTSSAAADTAAAAAAAAAPAEPQAPHTRRQQDPHPSSTTNNTNPPTNAHAKPSAPHPPSDGGVTLPHSPALISQKTPRLSPRTLKSRTLSPVADLSSPSPPLRQPRPSPRSTSGALSGSGALSNNSGALPKRVAPPPPEELSGTIDGNSSALSARLRNTKAELRIYPPPPPAAKRPSSGPNSSGRVSKVTTTKPAPNITQHPLGGGANESDGEMSEHTVSFQLAGSGYQSKRTGESTQGATDSYQHEVRFTGLLLYVSIVARTWYQISAFLAQLPGTAGLKTEPPNSGSQPHVPEPTMTDLTDGTSMHAAHASGSDTDFVSVISGAPSIASETNLNPFQGSINPFSGKGAVNPLFNETMSTGGSMPGGVPVQWRGITGPPSGPNSGTPGTPLGSDQAPVEWGQGGIRGSDQGRNPEKRRGAAEKLLGNEAFQEGSKNDQERWGPALANDA